MWDDPLEDAPGAVKASLRRFGLDRAWVRLRRSQLMASKDE
jgi:hypothetical protein